MANLNSQRPLNRVLSYRLTPSRTASGSNAASHVHPFTPQGRAAVARVVRLKKLQRPLCLS